MKTGKGIVLGNTRIKHLKSARPILARNLEEGLATETSLEFNLVDKGHTDVEGRLTRPVIVGNISSTELDRMAAEVVVKTDQPAHEKLLGLIHGDGIRQGLVLYTEYDCKDATCTREYAREANLCKIFSLAMILCNELGNFWAYRLQFPDISWTDANFPFKDLLPPRWTVRKWLARADEAANGQAAVASYQ